MSTINSWPSTYLSLSAKYLFLSLLSLIPLSISTSDTLLAILEYLTMFGLRYFFKINLTTHPLHFTVPISRHIVKSWPCALLATFGLSFPLSLLSFYESNLDSIDAHLANNMHSLHPISQKRNDWKLSSISLTHTFNSIIHAFMKHEIIEKILATQLHTIGSIFLCYLHSM